MAAARARFRRFGYAKTSMQEIAGACRMSAANLYRFYGSKLAIATAVSLAGQQEQLAACDAAVRVAPDDTTDRLIALLLANIDATRHRLRHAPLLFELGLRVSREDREVRRRFLEEVENRIVRILASEGRCRAAAASVLRARGRLILVASAPFVLPWMVQTEPFGDPRAHVEPLVRALVAALSGSRPARTAESLLRFS